jgi:hypothetical protein
MDEPTFRADYPEFADTTAYPSSAIAYWLALAGKLLNACRWADLIDTGTELFIAHNLVLERDAQKTAGVGGTPGKTQGPLASKSIDKVSASYDTSSGLDPADTHWNLTIYGTRFIRLVRMVGAGPIQV